MNCKGSLIVCLIWWLFLPKYFRFLFLIHWNQFLFQGIFWSWLSRVFPGIWRIASICNFTCPYTSGIIFLFYFWMFPFHLFFYICKEHMLWFVGSPLFVFLLYLSSYIIHLVFLVSSLFSSILSTMYVIALAPFILLYVTYLFLFIYIFFFPPWDLSAYLSSHSVDL